ncbi:prefoldin subunit [Candidatus Woesearchaeota archaeon]|nr:prefoldin subunit [Candidatus Woesearchaeota archaeon]
MTSEKVSRLQLTQQNLQSVAAQKQQLESQLAELDSAIKEIVSAKESFKIIGKIMVAKPKDLLQEELEQKKEIIALRLKNFTRQEQLLTKTIEELQQEVMKETPKNG